jgi:hypothetical protein
MRELLTHKFICMVSYAGDSHIKRSSYTETSPEVTFITPLLDSYSLPLLVTSISSFTSGSSTADYAMELPYYHLG